MKLIKKKFSSPNEFKILIFYTLQHIFMTNIYEKTTKIYLHVLTWCK